MLDQQITDISRRSSRVPISVPVLVTSLDPSNDFSEVCETLVVSAHGCAIRSPMKVKAGIPVHFHSQAGRQTMGRIVDCQPLGSNPQGWKLGAQLDEPDNFWGLNPCPEDWQRLHEAAAPAPRRVPERESHSHQPAPASEAWPQEPSQDRLPATVAQLLAPLQAELADLREKLAQRQANPSRFEVSLSQIPPQLEEKLWARLRQDVGQRALQLTREESERVLTAAHAAIEHKISKTQEELQQELAQALSLAEQRTQALADSIAENVQQHFRTGMERFQQQALDAEARLKWQDEELVQALQERLAEEHRTQRQELERAQDNLAAESSRLQGEIADIDSRLAKLDESARRLESEFEARLTAVMNQSLAGARAQLESTLGVLLKELRTRNAQELGRQLDEACARLHHVQSEIEAAISASLQSRVEESTEAFQQSMDQLAQHSVGRWRAGLASDLSSIAKALGQQLRIDALTGSGEDEHTPAK